MIAGLETGSDSGRKTILAINHFYDQDLRALRQANPGYNFVTVDGTVLFRSAKALFSEPVRDLLVPYDSAPESVRLIFREECRWIYQRLALRLRPALLITSNDNFFWVREFILLAREHGVPTVVIDKEGTITDYFFESEAKRARACAPPIAERYLVWSERQRDYWRACGAQADRIFVVGQPRSDLLFGPPADRIRHMFPLAQPLVTLFSFSDSAYLPYEYVARHGVSWRNLKRESHEEFHRQAALHPELNFVIKCHPQQEDIVALRDRYRTRNLVVIGGAADANELIMRSELLIGFQTTSLTEAMLLGRRIIYLGWHGPLPERDDFLIPFANAGGMVYAKSFAQYRTSLERFLSGDRSEFDFTQEALAARDAFVRRYLHQPDGHTAERVYAAIQDLLA